MRRASTKAAHLTTMASANTTQKRTPWASRPPQTGPMAIIA
jgi:hypothetical protein